MRLVGIDLWDNNDSKHATKKLSMSSRDSYFFRRNLSPFCLCTYVSREWTCNDLLPSLCCFRYQEKTTEQNIQNMQTYKTTTKTKQTNNTYGIKIQTHTDGHVDV